ncbi:MAG: DUF1634 domain-containing protein [Lactobacillaceae bacterium]|jgi:uncharacterized membrane protein|nr:DUF1634 domain-containing protein [Lactobacillaceae bacterium]
MNNKDLKMEKYLGWVLRVGAGISMIIMILGLIMAILHNRNSDLILSVGLFIMILTPVIRVVASIFIFAEEKNWMYVKITLFVLFVLSLAFLIGYNK